MKEWIHSFRYHFDQMLGPASINPLFYQLLNEQTAINFEKITGLNPLKVSNFFGLALYPPQLVPFQYDEQNNPGQVKCRVCATFGANFKVTLHWKSKTGKTYQPRSSDIDPDDIEFWLEGLNKEEVLEIWNNPAYNPKALGFRHKKTKYKLVVRYFSFDAIYIKVFIGNEIHSEEYLKRISEAISAIFEAHNANSQAKKYRYGVIHDFGEEEIKGNALVYYIDYGSAINKPLRTVVELLNEFDKIELVEFTADREL